jgi:hypothetical protein
MGTAQQHLLDPGVVLGSFSLWAAEVEIVAEPGGQLAAIRFRHGRLPPELIL